MSTMIDTKIVKSPHFVIYSRWLSNGMSFRECERRAMELFNESISYESFRLYKASMSLGEIVPNVFPYSQFDLEIDEVQLLMQIIVILRQRIADLLEIEKKMGGLLPLERIDRLLAQLANFAVKLANLRVLKGDTTTNANQYSNVTNGNRLVKYDNSPSTVSQLFDSLIQEANV